MTETEVSIDELSTRLRVALHKLPEAPELGGEMRGALLTLSLGAERALDEILERLRLAELTRDAYASQSEFRMEQWNHAERGAEDLIDSLRQAPMPVRESTMRFEEWEERYGEWWHDHASEEALARRDLGEAALRGNS